MEKKKEKMWKDFYFEINDLYSRWIDGFVACKKNPDGALTQSICAKAAITELYIILTEYEDLIYGELPF